MVEVPAETPVTNPEPFTVATAGLDELHGLDVSGVPLPVNWVESPLHTERVPEMVGNAFTVTTAVTLHPLLFV